ncbi:hypothetical protein Y032_0287g1448 [Ancylostoma ceylanicum]|uniref:Uncharacterized protein n=1 Tax=Ancylostoma ceylanicum TaxID=53326 RepID=A0A016S5Q0_9BILA|nr:hypothetical protein Y032_0287g1448 [Ancylostoma ceylanicum]
MLTLRGFVVEANFRDKNGPDRLTESPVITNRMIATSSKMFPPTLKTSYKSSFSNLTLPTTSAYLLRWCNYFWAFVRSSYVNS